MRKFNKGLYLNLIIILALLLSTNIVHSDSLSRETLRLHVGHGDDTYIRMAITDFLLSLEDFNKSKTSSKKKDSLYEQIESLKKVSYDLENKLTYEKRVELTNTLIETYGNFEHYVARLHILEILGPIQTQEAKEFLKQVVNKSEDAMFSARAIVSVGQYNETEILSFLIDKIDTSPRDAYEILCAITNIDSEEAIKISKDILSFKKTLDVNEVQLANIREKASGIIGNLGNPKEDVQFLGQFKYDANEDVRKSVNSAIEGGVYTEF